MEDHIKKVDISGINNRYQMKKIINERTPESKQKKRIPSANWDTHEDIYTYTKQLLVISDISNNNYDSTDDVSKIFIQEIGKKISGYYCIQKDIENSGAQYIRDVVADGNIITAPHYDFQTRWMQEVVKAVNEKQRNKQCNS